MMEDYRNFAKLAQSFSAMDSVGGVVCEPSDAPLDSRHLDMLYAAMTLTDKIYMGNVVSGTRALDTIRMSEILFGGREAIEQTPACFSLINCNSPLRWDDRMLEAQFEYAKAMQPVVLTPFLLMGAMSPVSIPSTLPSRWPRRSRASHSPSSSGRSSRDLRASCRTSTCSPARLSSALPSPRSACCAPADRTTLRAAVPLRRRAQLITGSDARQPSSRS